MRSFNRINGALGVAFLIVACTAAAPSVIAQIPQLDPVPDFSGRWRPATCVPDGETCPFVVAELPLTRVGRNLAAAYEEPIGPKYDCFQATEPSLFVDPYAWAIHQLEDRLIFEYEKDDIIRTVWLEGWGHPEPGPYEAWWQGHSVGKFEDGQLVVTTDRFMYDPTGLEDLGGIPSSTLKRVIARYSMLGERLRVEVTTEDPLILEEPVSFTVEFTRQDEQLFLPYGCERDQARQPIQFADPNRKISVQGVGQSEPTRGGRPIGDAE